VHYISGAKVAEKHQ